ncbi:MAG: hypothetical protein ACOC0N_03830 [Chroococcales cyanobacterium]
MKFKFEDMFEDLGPGGIAAGIGAVVLAPVLIPAVTKVGKPGEVFEDMVAEARVELAEDQAKNNKQIGEGQAESA